MTPSSIKIYNGSSRITLPTVSLSSYSNLNVKISFSGQDLKKHFTSYTLSLYFSDYTIGPTSVTLINNGKIYYPKTTGYSNGAVKVTYSLNKVAYSPNVTLLFSYSGPAPTLYTDYASSSFKPSSSLLYVSPSSSFPLSNTIKDYGLDGFISYVFNYALKKGFIKKEIFKNILPYPISIVFDNQSIVPRLSICKTIDKDNLRLKDEYGNYQYFYLAHNADETYINSGGNGQLLKKISSYYRLYSLLSNSYEQYNSSGKLIKIVDELEREINIVYSTDDSLTTATDYFGNTISVSHTTTTTSTKITNKYQILLNNVLFYDVTVVTNMLPYGSHEVVAITGTINEYKDNSIFNSSSIVFNIGSYLPSEISFESHSIKLFYDSSYYPDEIRDCFVDNNTIIYFDVFSIVYGDWETKFTNIKDITYAYSFDKNRRFIGQRCTDRDNIEIPDPETQFIYRYTVTQTLLRTTYGIPNVSEHYHHVSQSQSYTTPAFKCLPASIISSTSSNSLKIRGGRCYQIDATLYTPDCSYEFNDEYYSKLIVLVHTENNIITYHLNELFKGNTSARMLTDYINIPPATRVTSIELQLCTTASGTFSLISFTIRNIKKDFVYFVDNNIEYKNANKETIIYYSNSTNSEYEYQKTSILLSDNDLKSNQLLKAKNVLAAYFNDMKDVVLEPVKIKYRLYKTSSTYVEKATENINFYTKEYNSGLVVENKPTYSLSDTYLKLEKNIVFNQNNYSSFVKYNSYNQPKYSIDENNIVTNFEYDSFHSISSKTIGPAGYQITTNYNYYGSNYSDTNPYHLLSVTSPVTNSVSNVRTYSYVVSSLCPIKEYNDDSSSVNNKLTYNYISNSTYNYVSSISKDNKSNSNTHTSNRLTSITSNTSPTFSYTYDDYNLLSSIKLNNNNLVTIVNTLNDTNNNNYDYQTVTYSNNYSYTLTKDKYNRLISLKEGSTDKIIYQYGYITSNNPITYDISTPYSDAKLLYTIDYYVNDTECYFYDSSNRVNKMERYHSTNVSSLSNLYLEKVITYDDIDRVSSISIDISNLTDYIEDYTYETYKDNLEGFLSKHIVSNTDYVLEDDIDFDSSRRLDLISSSLYVGPSSDPTEKLYIEEEYNYHGNTSTLSSRITNIVDDIDSSNPNNPIEYKNFAILYDNKGNITNYNENLSIANVNALTNSYAYIYDNLNRLVYEDIEDITYSSSETHYQYIYDNNGNITSVKTKNSLGTYDDYLTFTYNSTYVDRLDSFIDYSISTNPISLTYDNFLNPTSIGDKTFTYTRGRLLESYKATPNTTTNYIYSYNKDGIRASKFKKNIISPSNIIPLEEHKYYYDNKKLIMEERVTYTSGTISSTHYLRYFYSSEGVKAFLYDNSLYYYLKDIFNNVVALLDSSNNVIARYSYDSYGNTLVLTPNGSIDTSPTSMGNINPFRYRSYYYDSELEMYYCLSRYYYPYIRRWLNGDDLNYLDKDALGGINLYAYCLDNPVMYRDEDGRLGILGSIIVTVLFAFGLAGTINDIYQIASGNIKATPSSDKKSVEIENSYRIHTPWMRWLYSFYLNHINPETKDIIKGSTAGVEFEWAMHNIAYIFNYKREQTADVDLGASIFSDSGHPVFGDLMKAMYIISNQWFYVLWDYLVANE